MALIVVMASTTRGLAVRIMGSFRTAGWNLPVQRLRVGFFGQAWPHSGRDTFVGPAEEAGDEHQCGGGERCGASPRPAGSLDPAHPSWEGRSHRASERETSDVRRATCEDPDRSGAGRAGGRAGVGGGRDAPAVVVAELPRRGGPDVPVRGCAGAA